MGTQNQTKTSLFQSNILSSVYWNMAYNELTVAVIKDELQKHGETNLSGAKKVLITRLQKIKNEEYSYDNWNAKELKAEAKSRGLSQGGSKAVLVKRLLADDENDEEDEMEVEEVKKPVKKKVTVKKKKTPAKKVVVKSATRKSTRKRKATKTVEDEVEEEEEDLNEPPQKKLKLVTEKKETKAEHKAKMKFAKIDPLCEKKYLGGCDVEIIEDVMLNQTNITAGRNNNKFYAIQVILNRDDGLYYTWTRWGRIGEEGRGKMFGPFGALDAAMKEHDKKIRDKTVKGNYIKVDLAYGDEEEEMNIKVSNLLSSNTKVAKCTLPKETQDLLRLIFNHDMFKTQMAALDVNVDEMPLGKLSKTQIKKGYSVLIEIKSHLDNNKTSDLAKLSSQFFTLIPHSFGRKKPPVINNVELLHKKMDLLNILGDIEIATSLEKKSTSMVDIDVGEVIHPLDQKYATLGAALTPIKKNSKLFKTLETYVNNTKYGNIKILEIFEVDRETQNVRFDAFDDLENRKLLFHGTNIAVVAAILNSGLRIMEHSGGRVGKGIYFASENSKSAGYVSCAENIGIMFLNEVALGKEHHILNDDWTLRKPPSGFDSIIALGRTEPDPSKNTTIELNGHEIVVPQGKAIKIHEDNRQSSRFSQTEYLVYNEGQTKIRFLLKLQF